MWPAYFLPQEDTSGTLYIRSTEFQSAFERHSYHGQAWQLHKTWTTYCPNRKVTYKNIARLNVNDRQDFNDIMGNCEAVGMNPPTSFGDCWRKVFHEIPLPSIIAPFWGMSFGGWQWIKGRTEFVRGPYYHYDLNKAYRWSACQGLPDMQSAYKLLTRFHLDMPYSMYVIDVEKGAIPYSPREGIKAVTNEEIIALDLKPKTIIRGMGFESGIDLTPMFGAVDFNFPTCSARISRSFWGQWNARKGPRQIGFASNAQRDMRNLFYNPIWAAFIASRVTLRLYNHRHSMLQCLTDALITPEILPTGPDIGQWKLVNSYPRLWFKSPGFWGSGNLTIKHSGLA